MKPALWPRGRSIHGDTGDRELAIVVLGGICSVDSPAGSWNRFGERANVFDGLPYTLYLPVGTPFRLTADTAARSGLLLLPRGGSVSARSW